MDNISWSLKPILTFLGVLGVDLQLTGTNRSALGRCIRFLLGVVLFSGFVVIRLYLFVTDEMENTIKEMSGGQFSLTATWTRNLRHLTSAVSPLFIYSSFLAATAFKWRHLADATGAMLRLMHLDRHFYRQLRRISIAGLVWMFAVMSHFFIFFSIFRFNFDF